MRIGIMGFSQSGKTTLFNVLARAHAPTGQFASAAGGVNVGTVSVPDPRLERLRDLFQPKKYTPARVEYVDFAGAPGAAKEGAEALYPAQLRAAELIVCCLRAFRDEAVPHPFDSIDPLRDRKRFDEELLFRDLTVLDNRIQKLEKGARVGAGKGEDPFEKPLLLRCREALENDTPLRELDLSPDDQRRLKGFQLLSEKPILYVVNIGETDLPEGPENVRDWLREPSRPHSAVVAVAAKTEMELASLEGAERDEFMSLLGIRESSLDRLIRISYELLGLCSFFTVGPDEVRAWTIPAGSRAVEAAGEIHSDLARGFIRAEVSRWDDLLAAGGYGPLRDKGKLRLEGKEYRVEDGDVLNIRFSV
jgi:GTP-binding protein YchF